MSVMNTGMIKYLETIVGCGFFHHISKSDWIEAFEQLEVTLRTCRKGEIICHMGDTLEAVYIVEDGSVRAEKTYPSGDVHIVSVYEEDDVLALGVILSRRKTSPVDLVANEDCRMIMIPRQSMEGSRYRDRLMNALIEMLADENIRQMHKIEILAERGLRDRVLVYLNVLTRKSGTNTVTVKMSREQLAQYLCVNRSALSNELSKMKREGLIDFQKDQFTLLQAGLKAATDQGLGEDSGEEG